MSEMEAIWVDDQWNINEIINEGIIKVKGRLHWGTYLQGQRVEDAETLQKVETGRLRFLLEVLVGANLKLRQYLCGQDHPQKEAGNAGKGKGTTSST